jgi:TonB family protein
MERRLFEDLLESDVVAHKGRKGYTLPVSIVAHLVAIFGIVIVPLLTSEEMPEPTTAVKAFFAEPPAPPPPPPPAPMVPQRVGGMIRPPTKIVDVPPIYPPMAIAARVEGLVIIEAVIDTDGRVQSARVLRSHPLLDTAALTAVGQWSYTPSLLNGMPVPVIMTVTVAFKLR